MLSIKRNNTLTCMTSYVEASELPTEECCVCFDRTINTRLEPCKHVALCYICALQLNHSKCPLCRVPITRLVKLTLKQEIFQPKQKFKSGYTTFENDNYNDVYMKLFEAAGKGPKITGAEIAKKLSQNWVNLPIEEKRFWDDKARGNYGVNCGF
jgi:hypothetical protein